MRCKINLTELVFLRDCIKDSSVLEKICNLLSSKKKRENFHYILELSQVEIEIILNELTFLFTLQGVENDGEANEFGLRIEKLIDVFYRD